MIKGVASQRDDRKSDVPPQTITLQTFMFLVYSQMFRVF